MVTRLSSVISGSSRRSRRFRPAKPGLLYKVAQLPGLTRQLGRLFALMTNHLDRLLARQRPVQVLVQELERSLGIDRVRSIEPLDFTPVTDFQFSLVEVANLAEFVADPFVLAHPIKVTPFDHEWSWADERSHFGIIEGAAQVPLKDLVFTVPDVAEVVPAGGVLEHPFVKVCRANGETVISDQGGNPHGRFAPVAESVEGDSRAIDLWLGTQPVQNLLVLWNHG